MVLRAKKFTPEVLLAAPRRSAGVPNATGSHVLFTVSTYGFESHEKSTTLEVVNVKSGQSTVLIRDTAISDLQWLNEAAFVYLQSEEDGRTGLWHGSIQTSKPTTSSDSYLIGTLDSAAGNLKLAALGQDDYAVVVSQEVVEFGTNRTLRSSGKLYTGLFVRHWDRYEDQAHNTLCYARLSKGENGLYKLSEFHNALEKTGLECPIRPFGGTDCFDISAGRIIFTAKDPDLDPALNTKVNVYLLTVKSWDRPLEAFPEPLYVSGYEGAISSPVFSPDGKKAAFLAMKTNGYEADKNRIFVVSDVKVSSTKPSVTQVQYREDSFWDRSPASIDWSTDGTTLLAVAEDKGYAKLFALPLNPNGVVQPSVVTSTGSVSAVSPLLDSKVMVSGSNLVDNSLFAIMDLRPSTTSTGDLTIWRHSNSSDGNRFGLSYSQVSSIWTPASNPKINKEVHSWVVKPSNFDKSKKYPVAYLIHGGPQGSWADSWSTRWNPAVFAEQGYIVIAPNPTGSTGYGQAFTDAIQNNWGGDPYQDIVNVFEWVSKHMGEADNDRAVALGASYGGYMMNWIQGHDLGRKFRALVCHDGIFACANMLATDELYFAFHDLGGTPFYNPSAKGDKDAMQELAKFKYATYASWRRWDPSEHLDKWSTPQLVIHSSKDYRIAISEGLAAFNVLQARGVESQFLTFPDENHWVLKPENSLLWHKVVLNWINGYVGLPSFTTVSPADEAFFGGVKTEVGDLGGDMPVQGKPET